MYQSVSLGSPGTNSRTIARKDRDVKFTQTSRELRDLVVEFNSGAILLPQFQRDYVWTAVKIRNLLDSLLRGFPIGGFYLWRPTGTGADPKHKAFGKQQFTAEVQGILLMVNSG
jgi:Protein of unknown function DUF262